MMKFLYLQRYRALGKKLEVERLHISKLMDNETGKAADKHTLGQKQYQDNCNALLIELHKLEEMLFE